MLVWLVSLFELAYSACMACIISSWKTCHKPLCQIQSNAFLKSMKFCIESFGEAGGFL